MPRSVATSISTSGPVSITPKAFFNGRANGVTTARALTALIAGMLLLISRFLFLFGVSFDTVPSDKFRRGPIGRSGLDQPASRRFGRERDALGLARFDRKRIQPIGLPAIVEPVEQPEMVAVQMEGRCYRRAIDEREHDDAARLDTESGRRGRREHGRR